MTTPGNGQMKAFFVSAGNPVLSVPNGEELESAFEQLEGSPARVQIADHSETRNRCWGRLQDALGSNMRSCRTKSRAHAQ